MKVFTYLRKQKAVWLITAISFCTCANAQDKTAMLASQFKTYQEGLLQEKLFMHTDRDFYLAGDLLWFKLYAVDAGMHLPLDLSKVAYVEILDRNHKPVLQSKVGMSIDGGNGSMYLPVTLNSEKYTIRAYTNWMKNSGADYFFEKQITIVNAQKERDSAVAVKRSGATDIRFFPEGGNLVADMVSKVACKVVDPYGQSVVYTGDVVDENNSTVIHFSSLLAGMSSFVFTPQSGHNYKAVINIAGQTPVTKELPFVYKKGYVLSVTNQDAAHVLVQVQTNMDVPEVYLFVHTRQSVKAALSAKVINNKASFVIDRNKLGEGISHFTVFNNERQPVCERLYFTYPVTKLQVNIGQDKNTYANREKVTLQINATDQDAKPETAGLSMAVYEIDSLQSIDETDIGSYLWLSAELKGRIESPNAYFTAAAKASGQAIDNLLLTQGWRRFSWEEVLAGKKPGFDFAPEYNGHLITGRVFNSRTGKPMEGVETYLSVPGADGKLAVSISDTAGRLRFDVKDMRGGSEVIVQPVPVTDTLARIEINTPFADSYSENILPPFTLSNKYRSTISDLSVATQVQNIYSGARIRPFMATTDTVSFFGKPDGTYFLDDYTRFTTMDEVIREYVNFMDVIKTGNKFRFALLDLSTNHYFDVEPLLLLDGVPFFNTDRFMKVDPLKLRKLEVVNRRYLYGNTFFNGVMNFTSYKNDIADAELDPRATVIDYEALQLKREFYAPVYDTEEKKLAHTPDFRTVLYWTPDIRTGASGKQSVSFYTSDKKGKYIAVLQGLAKDGKFGSGTIAFEVR